MFKDLIFFPLGLFVLNFLSFLPHECSRFIQIICMLFEGDGSFPLCSLTLQYSPTNVYNFIENCMPSTSFHNKAKCVQQIFVENHIMLVANKCDDGNNQETRVWDVRLLNISIKLHMVDGLNSMPIKVHLRYYCERQVVASFIFIFHLVKRGRLITYNSGSFFVLFLSYQMHNHRIHSRNCVEYHTACVFKIHII